MSERLLTAWQVAEHLGVSVETVLRWHRSGKLPGDYRLSSSVLRFRESEVEAWLEARADLRPSSTFASNALSLGVTVYELARIMGTSVGMIEAHYGALLDTAHDSLLERLEGSG